MRPKLSVESYFTLILSKVDEKFPKSAEKIVSHEWRKEISKISLKSKPLNFSIFEDRLSIIDFKLFFDGWRVVEVLARVFARLGVDYRTVGKFLGEDGIHSVICGKIMWKKIVFSLSQET